jgi:hypothetical protein
LSVRLAPGLDEFVLVDTFGWLKVFFEILALVGLILVILLRRKPAAGTMPKAFFPWFLPALRRPWIAFLLVGLLGFGASALVTVFTGIPQPKTHDEFSYILAADTFAHGRVTNPPHPLWKHFETFHVIQHPTYASKYPPAQGLTLALGQVLTGYPIVGVWLSVGLACAAICWMLAGWCPLRWACIGGLVAVIRLAFSFAYWSQSYMGGAIAALGGALVFGGLPRIMKKRRVRDALCLAVGLAILANSRPFEGLVASIPVGVVLLVWIVKARGISWQVRFFRVVLPVILVLLLTAAWMGFYNFRVTGNPFLMPYQVYESTYGIAPVFLWQPLNAEPQYNHKIMGDFQRLYVDQYIYLRSLTGYVRKCIWDIAKFLWNSLGIIFIPSVLVLAMSRKVWRRWNVMFPVGVCTLMMAALLTEMWFATHYAAPITCLAFLIVVESLRQTRRFTWRDKPVGQQYVSGVLPILLVLAIASYALAQYMQKPLSWYQDRVRILRELEQSQGRHLVIVRYGPNHSPFDEWVYNRANIDGAKVVWAREMDAQADRELLDYFKDRRVWLFQADQQPRHLTPYQRVHPTSE